MRAIVTSFLEAVGFGLVAVGAGMAWAPLGFIAAGAALVFLGYTAAGDA